MRCEAGNPNGISTYSVVTTETANGSRRTAYSVLNAKAIFADFSGAKPFNRYHSKYLSIAIEDHEFAQMLIDLGCNVKIYIPKDEDEAEPVYHIPVEIDFKEGMEFLWPEIKLYNPSTNRETVLDEEGVAGLSRLNIIDMDVMFTLGKPWRDTAPNVKAWVKEMNVVASEKTHLPSRVVPMDEEELPFN